MADPFGTGAGIVGIIGLAIQITQVVVQFGMDWKDAPDNVKTFMAELGTLQTVLSETNTSLLLNPDFAAAFPDRPSLLLSQLGPNAPPTTNTKCMLEICRRELQSMLKELKKRGEGHRLGWERFRGAFLARDTRDSVMNLCRQCQTLNSMLSIDAAVLGTTTYKEVREARKEQQEISLVIREGVDKSNQRQENQEQQQERQDILRWLTPIDYAAQQSDLIGRREESTGQWLLDSEQFQAWVNTNNQTLFCPGIPGAGKTIITSIVVRELTSRFSTDSTIGTAYIYCNFRRQDEQKLDDLLMSLLKQLAGIQLSLPVAVRELYSQYKTKQTRPSLDEISRCLESVTALYSRAFLIIDALDECQISDGCRQRFLLSLFNLQEKYGVNIFTTSRPISSIMKEFEGKLKLEIRATDGDVRRYLDGHMFRLPGFVVRNPELQEEIKDAIVKAVDGMFLLAELYLESLSGKRAPKAVRATLNALATGSGAYNQAYESAMERINGQVKDYKELAKEVLWWITCANRPLATWELQHALAVEIGESQFDKDNLPDIEDMVSVCAGLVTIDEESEIIRLVHYTTQEYFERTQKQWFPDALTKITTICVTYLSFDVFRSGFCQSDEDFEERLRSNQFYSYAARNWGHHARKTLDLSQETSLKTKDKAKFEAASQAVVDFLVRTMEVEAASQALLAEKRFSFRNGYSQEVAKKMTGLHLAAYFGVKVITKLLLDQGADVKAAAIDGQTPLHWASSNGHLEVVRLLLDQGADVKAANIDGWTPLFEASSNGHLEVVRLLLDQSADVKAATIDGWTPLHWASSKGHLDIVWLLLNQGADVKAASIDGWTPLFEASFNRHLDIIRLLLDQGADVKAAATDGWTPLHWASSSGHLDVVRLLLDQGADIKAATIDGQTPLHGASSRGQLDVVRFLLNQGADFKAAATNGWTPLFKASVNGHYDIVRLLLDQGADVKAATIDGWTPLHWASSSGHLDVVRLLLNQGANFKAATTDGRTPLYLASFYGQLDVVRLLLDQGADVKAATTNGRTPLHGASSRGQLDVVRLLLDQGANFKAAGTDGWTPLFEASFNGRLEVVRLLLEAGASVVARDYIHRTPLLLAARNGNEANIKLLLAANRVDVNSVDYYNSTPLSIAARMGHREAVELLLNQSHSLSTKDNFDRSPLWWARKTGHSSIANLLLEKYKENDITVREDDLPTATISTLADKSFVWCDVYL